MTDNEKMDLILAEIQGIKAEVQGMKEEVQGMKAEMRETKCEVGDIKVKMQEMERDIRNLEDGMQEVKDQVQNVGQKVTGIQLILENEIRVNIQRVAEGHLDLSRNLHDAMHPSSEVEMLAVKVRMLESDVKTIKAKVFA